MLSWGQGQQALLTVSIHSGMNQAPDSSVYQGLIREDPTGWLILSGGDFIKRLFIILPHILPQVIQRSKTLSSVSALPPQGQPGWDESSIKSSKTLQKCTQARTLYIGCGLGQAASLTE